MIDTHCHLSIDDYPNLDDLINEMKEKNIKAIVNGCDVKTNEETLILSKNENIYAANGYHPENIDALPSNYLEILKNNIPNIVALGEIGFDYYWRKDNKEEQIKIFKEQLSIAEEYNLPVIIHTRESIMETYNIIKDYKVKGVIHAFSGSYEMAKKFIDLGYKLGIGGVITFKNCNLKDVVSKIDISDIVLETDSPYLSPVPVRGKKNSPLNLIYIAKYIAELKEIEYSEVIKITSLTASQLFDL